MVLVAGYLAAPSALFVLRMEHVIAVLPPQLHPFFVNSRVSFAAAAFGAVLYRLQRTHNHRHHCPY